MSTKTSTPNDQPTIEMERVFKAPRELVWDCFTKVEHLQKWWGGPHVSNTNVSIDVRVGGKWTHTMRFPDGQEMTMHWTFFEVERPSVLSWGADGPVDGPLAQEKEDARMRSTFSDVAGGTLWRMVATFASEQFRDRAFAGGFSKPIEASNESLDQYLATIV